MGLIQNEGKKIVSEDEKMVCYAIAAMQGARIDIEKDEPLNRMQTSEVISCLESLRGAGLIKFQWVGTLVEASLLVEFSSIDVDRTSRAVAERIMQDGNKERSSLKFFVTPSKYINPSGFDFLELRKLMSGNIDWASRKLNELEYPEYLLTPYWQILSHRVKHDNGFSCVLCNCKESLHCHHRTYPRRGTEILNHLSILTCLCDTCHSLYHNAETR